METKRHKFEFTKENLQKIQQIMAKYPAGKQQSAVMPLLYLAQKQEAGNWVSKAAMDAIADLLGMPKIRVYEIATFYTMYNKAPVGKYLVQVCRTTPCWLNGAEDITTACRKKLNINVGETTQDRMFTLVEVECLGACVNAPIVQINDDYYEDLDESSIIKILEEFQEGKQPKAGSRKGRRSSEPIN